MEDCQAMVSIAHFAGVARNLPGDATATESQGVKWQKQKMDLGGRLLGEGAHHTADRQTRLHQGSGPKADGRLSQDPGVDNGEEIQPCREARTLMSDAES